MDGQWSQKHSEILQIIAHILKLDITQLHRDSNIFELGLDSISVIGFASSLQRTGLQNAKASSIMRNPTLGQLIAAISDDKRVDKANEDAYLAAAQHMKIFSYKYLPEISKELEIEPHEIEAINPCTPMQEGMIYRFLESDHALYFNKFSFWLRDAVEADKLLNAWREASARLQVLRTKFILTDDGYAQVVTKTNKLNWTDLAMDQITVDKPLALQFPFRIEFEASSCKRRMNVLMFHALYDANGLTMLFQRIAEEYNGVPNINYGPPFTKSLEYGPLALRADAEHFWAKHLESWTDDLLPVKYENTEDVLVSKELHDITDLEERRKSLGVTYQAIIMAAWVSAIRKVKPSSPTIGIIVSGRTIDFEGADQVIGPLFNIVPFHIDIDPGTTWRNLIQKCHEFNVQSQVYQHTPLKDIQKWCRAGKTRQSLFDNLFVFQRISEDENTFAKEIWTQVDNPATADVSLSIIDYLPSTSNGSIVSPSLRNDT